MENAKTVRLFLKVVEFYSTFDIEIDITLGIFRKKLQNDILEIWILTNIDVNIHISRATHYEIMTL